MEKIKDIALAKRILDFLAKRIGAEKIELYHNSFSTSILLTTVFKTKSLINPDERLHFQIDSIFIKFKSSKHFFDNPDKCLLALVNQMFEKAQTKNITTDFDDKIVLYRYECPESILIEMDLND